MPLSKAKDRERKQQSRLEIEYTGSCADCGYGEHPEILVKHHSDGDRSNNEDSNLIKLCPNCHARRHSPNGVLSFGSPPLQPSIADLLAAQGLGIARGRIIDVQPISNLESAPIIPFYDPGLHSAGDTVKVKRGKRWVTMTIPELDLDGNPMLEE